MGITVLCPTRGNPAALREAHQSFVDTATRRDSRFVAVVDGDDPLLEQYVSEAEDVVDLRLDLVPKGETGTMNKALNWAAVRWAKRDSVVGFIGDDHRFRTRGWDDTIVSVLDREGGGFAYGNDLFQGERLPTQVFISSQIVLALGWFAPPAQWHLYLDDAWKLLGDTADCLYYLPDVVVEHMHPAAGKAEWDENHQRVNSSAFYDHDRAEFERWRQTRMAEDVRTVRRAIGRSA